MQNQFLIFKSYTKQLLCYILKVCNKNPKWISENATALSAIEIMNSLKITSLLVARNNEVKKKKKNIF